MRLFAIIIILALTPGCALLAFTGQFDCGSTYVDHRYDTDKTTTYLTKPNKTTVKGIKVDTSGFDIDLDKVDRLTEEVATCLNVKVKTCGFRVKIAPDFKYHECSRKELFPCKLPGMTKCLNDTCPCGCTGYTQYPNTTVITTKNLASYKHELIHVLTHKDHGDPVFRKCE